MNLNISHENSTVTYANIQDAMKSIQIFSPKAFMAKSDIANVFRLIPLHPSQYHLTGFFFGMVLTIMTSACHQAVHLHVKFLKLSLLH